MALAKAIKMLQPKVGATASNTLIKPKPPIINTRPVSVLQTRTPTLLNNPNLGKPVMTGSFPQVSNANPNKSFMPPQGMQPMMPTQGIPMQGQPRPLAQFAPNPGRPAPMGMPQGMPMQGQPRPVMAGMPPQGEFRSTVELAPYLGGAPTMTGFGGGLSSGMLQNLAGRYNLNANALLGNQQVPQVQNQQMPFQQSALNGFENKFPMTRFPDSNPYQMNSMQPMQNYQQQSMFPQSGYQLQQPQQQPQQSMYPQYGNFGNQFANQNQNQSQNLGGLDSAIQNMNQNNSWF